MKFSKTKKSIKPNNIFVALSVFVVILKKVQTKSPQFIQVITLFGLLTVYMHSVVFET